MNKSIYAVGTFAIALLVGVVPVVVLAEKNSGEDGAHVQVSASSQRAGTTAHEDGSEDIQVQHVRSEASSSDEQKSDDKMKGDDQGDEELEIDLEDDEDLASSFDDLQQKIEVRKHQLANEEASTTPELRDVVKNANEVRLAVHSLLSSKELLGGIGSEVSQIAKDMNNSVATTTNVEAKIQSRGFLTRLLFGGDAVAADVLAQEVARNQQHIDDLTKLLGEANVPADIQAVLKAQIAAVQDAQIRLQDLSQKEQKQWGLFSWRF